MLTIEKREEQQVPVWAIKGRFDAQGEKAFDQAAAGAGALVHLVVDLAGVEFLSSAGIRSLIKLEKQLRRKHGGMVLAAPPNAVKQVLDLAGLLAEFRAADNVSAAVGMVVQLRENAGETRVVNREGREYRYHALAAKGCHITRWGSLVGLDPSLKADALATADLAEVGFGLAIGGLGATRQQALENLGEMMLSPQAAGVLAAGSQALPDYLVAARSGHAPVSLAGGFSFAGAAAGVIDVASAAPFTLATLVSDIRALVAQQLPPAWGFVVLAQASGIRGVARGKDAVAQPLAGGGFVGVGIEADVAALRQSPDRGFASSADHFARFTAGVGRNLRCHGIALENVSFLTPGAEPLAALRPVLTLDNFVGVARLDPSTAITRAQVWIFLPSTVVSHTESGLKIEIADGRPFREEYEIIARRLYPDAGRIVVTTLHGGFSASTYQVTSYDRDGRRLLATVMKIGALALMKDEEDAFHKYVEPFILNNSTVVQGSAEHGDWKGIRYNFLGIGGPDSRISWLRQCFLEWPTERLEPLFDRIFTQILKPWYGQPRWEMTNPYCVGTLEIFPTLFDVVREKCGIDADAERIDCPELGQKLPNPYHFLKHRVAERKNDPRLWYVGINHGDLNMQNILLDERENLYIIDFSFTKVRNIVSDFARLEPIFKFEMMRMESDEDLKRLLEFEEALARPKTIGEMPPFVYRGDDPMVEKSWKLICKLRGYANTVTLFETDIVPYLLAVLEWTWPVPFYGQINDRTRRYAVLSAALICDQILKLENR